MEFSYSVSESDYADGWKLRRKGGRSRTIKTLLFWIFILICLMVLWGVVSRSPNEAPVESVPVSTTTTHDVLVNVVPFVLIGALWFFMLFRIGPWTLRRLYRKDPLMRGVYSVAVTPELLSMTNTAGCSSQMRWNIFKSWREGKNLIVLLMHSGGHFFLVLSGLSEPERDELRGILEGALPRA